MLPAVGTPQEANRRVQCHNNLRHIGMAMLNYQQQYGCFPPAFIPNENGKPKHSWRLLILPFLGEDGHPAGAQRSEMPLGDRFPTTP
jgi:hypothetical protein